MTLTEFLLARIAEDEAGAHAADAISKISDNIADADSDEIVDHIARWDPPRVLAECRAKRRIIERRRAIGLPDLPGGAAPGTLHALHDEVDRQRDFVFRCMATIYADHPDYDQAWTVLP